MNESLIKDAKVLEGKQQLLKESLQEQKNVSDDEKLENLKPLPYIRGANKNFFKDYGHPDDPASFISQSKLIIVRHGQSKENEFNEKAGEIVKFPNLYITDKVVYERLLDSKLSSLGRY